jgi:hypothetical protein
MQDLIEQLNRIEKRMMSIEVHTRRMEGHINFVERVYNVVRLPLDFVIECVNKAISFQDPKEREVKDRKNGLPALKTE